MKDLRREHGVLLNGQHMPLGTDRRLHSFMAALSSVIRSAYVTQLQSPCWQLPPRLPLPHTLTALHDCPWLTQVPVSQRAAG